ncbi:MAG: hypothetical protein HGA39_01995 [Coriobacteriia bacterium]|nr:hypothetical protein [Coriobacteriia bacterium]
MADNFDWTGFRELVRRLDDLIGGDRTDAEFAEELRRAVTFIYTAGVTAPSAGDIYEGAGGEAFWADAVDLGLSDIDPDEAETAALALAERLAISIEAAQPEGDVDEESLEDLAEAAAQGLLDAATVLSGGSKHFDAGRLQEAAWEWSFQFDDWGTSALASLTALHELLWGAR